MVNTYRCIIKGKWGNYFVAEDYNGNTYRIEKNENIHCKVGNDIYFYAIKKHGILSTILIPVSDEEAGVR